MARQRAKRHKFLSVLNDNLLLKIFPAQPGEAQVHRRLTGTASRQNKEPEISHRSPSHSDRAPSPFERQIENRFYSNTTDVSDAV